MDGRYTALGGGKEVNIKDIAGCIKVTFGLYTCEKISVDYQY